MGVKYTVHKEKDKTGGGGWWECELLCNLASPAMS